MAAVEPKPPDLIRLTRVDDMAGKVDMAVHFEHIDTGILGVDTKEMVLAGDTDIATKSAELVAYDQAGQGGRVVAPLLLVDLVEPGAVPPACLPCCALHRLFPEGLIFGHII